MSLARAHFHRTVAARESQAAAASPTAPAPGTLADRMLALLAMHYGTLKTLRSRTLKIEAKREMLPEYAAYIEGVIASDSGAPDDVLTTIMLWRLDVADFDGALAIAAYALRHGLAMPATFNRDVPTTLVEEIADYALALAEPSPEMAGPLGTALELTGDTDMHDQVRAKAHKALGLIFEASDPERALAHLEAALSLDPGCGVKTKITRLKKALESPPAGT